MENRYQTDLLETIKSFLIVGETLNEVYSFSKIRRKDIFISIIFFLSTVYALKQAIDIGIYWLLLTISFLMGMIYYILHSKVDIIYTITKYRIIKFERNVFSKFLFKSSELLGFTDLHYEHVESVNIGPPKVRVSFIYGSIFGIAIGWLILDTLDTIILLPSNRNFYQLIAIIILIGSTVNLFFILPIGGIRLVVQSVSGTTMEFPENKMPREFISQLLINCRTFLSYGSD